MTSIGLSPRTQEILAAALEETHRGLSAVGGIDELLRLHRETFGPLRMEDGDDKDDSGGAGGGDDDDSGGDDGDSDDEDSGDADDDGRDPKKKISALEEEKNRQWKRRKAAEKARDEALAELQKLQNADKSEVEQAAAKVPDLEKTVEAQGATIRQLSLENAFLTDNSFQWQNPKRALQLVDMSEVEIDDDGKVTGLDSALKALAKSDPYLLKPKSDDKEKLPNSGDPTNKDKREKQTADRQTLQQKYPGLRR